MKFVLLTICLGCFIFSGCGEEFAIGLGTGAALVNEANNNVLNAIAELNAKTEEINSTVASVDGMVVINSDTIEAIRSLKGREKDPITWIALVSILLNSFVGGKVLSDRKKK